MILQFFGRYARDVQLRSSLSLSMYMIEHLYISFSEFCMPERIESFAALVLSKMSIYNTQLLRLPIVLQHLRVLNKNASQISGGALRSAAYHHSGIWSYFEAKSPVSCGLDRTRTCDLTDVNGAF